MKKLLVASFVALTAFSFAECMRTKGGKRRIQTEINLDEETKSFIENTQVISNAFAQLFAETYITEDKKFRSALATEFLRVMQKRTEVKLIRMGINRRDEVSKEVDILKLKMSAVADKCYKEELRVETFLSTNHDEKTKKYNTELKIKKRKHKASVLSSNILEEKMKLYSIVLFSIVKDCSAETLELFLKHVEKVALRLNRKTYLTINEHNIENVLRTIEKTKLTLSEMVCSLNPMNRQFPIVTVALSEDVRKYNVLIRNFADDKARSRQRNQDAMTIIRRRTLRTGDLNGSWALSSKDYLGKVKKIRTQPYMGDISKKGK